MEQRGLHPHLLVLDAGNSLIGDRAPAAQTQGASSVEMMNMMGYDAMALGEGDLGQLGVDVIRQRMAEADFAFLSANAFLTGTEELVVQPYAILQMAGKTVVIVGLTGKADIPGVEIRDPLTAAEAAIAQVRAQADVIILLSHAGLETNQQIAQALHELSLIVSGGGTLMTRQYEQPGDGAAIVHADVPAPGHAGRRIGAGVWLLGQEGRIEQGWWENIALTPLFPDDPEMSAWVERNR